jgi:hypothetical protein
MRRLALLLACAGCNAILGIDEPTLRSGTAADAPTGGSDGGGGLPLTVVKNGAGGVTSMPPGIDCSGACPSQTASFSTQPIRLVATAAPGYTFTGWGGCPAQDNADCVIDNFGSPSLSVTATFTRIANNIVFVTSTAYSGDLGGLDGADMKCKMVATAGGLPGTYVALLGMATSSLYDQLLVSGVPARGFARVDGLPIADTQMDLLETHKMWYAANLTEAGKAATMGTFWSGSSATGHAGTDDCSGWTRSDNAAAGQVGQIAGAANFANVNRVGCDNMNPLMCVEVDSLSAITPPTPMTGKLAFLSKGTFTPSQGLDAANALCNGEKPAAVSGPVIALLATSGHSAKSLLTGSYVRADGIPLAFYGGFGDSSEPTGIWVHGDGSYAEPAGDQTPIRIWTGSGIFGNVPVGTGHNCGDWTPGAGMGDIGFPIAGAGAWSGKTALCGQALQLYCVEQ